MVAETTRNTSFAGQTTFWKQIDRFFVSASTTGNISILLILYTFMGNDSIMVNLIFSILAALAVYHLIPIFAEILGTHGLSGIDMCKSKAVRVPEALGVVTGSVYLICIFLFLPFPFSKWFSEPGKERIFPIFPFHKLGEFTCSLLSICSMLFLGFADDVMNLKWRYKLLLPAVASLPMLLFYSASSNLTSIAVPYPLSLYFGTWIDLGIWYYVYMASTAVFCTNAINILAGINGLEVGQVLVISASIIINNYISIKYYSSTLPAENHLFSIFMITPLFFTSIPLAMHNLYPAKVFVGDTFCYFAGMTIAVSGIMGHFSKTMMLFFIPQSFNFLLSLLQLSKIFPCPRHRLPFYNSTADQLEPSRFHIKNPNNLQLNLCKYLSLLGLCQYSVSFNNLTNSPDSVDSCGYSTPASSNLTCSNLTLLNVILIHSGPLHEKHLTWLVLFIQALFSLLAFLIRFQLVHLFYDK